MAPESILYRQISKDLAKTIAADANSGYSTAILAPAYGGKTVLIRHLQGLLRPQSFVSLEFESDRPHEDEAALSKDIALQIANLGIGLAPPLRPSGGLLATISATAQVSDERLIVLISAADGMAYHLATKLLSELQSIQSDGKVVAIVTGEAVLRDLVIGESAVLNPDRVYMLQGYSQETFEGDIAPRYIRAAQGMGLEFDTTATSTLWELTGGSDPMLAAIFFVLFERVLWLRDRAVDNSTLVLIANDVAERGIRGAPSFSRADQLLSRDPTCWDDLERLAKGDRVLAPPIPGTLEFGGIAIRRDGLLRAASTMMETFLRRRYDSVRLGDFYGRTGCWDKAFDLYSRAGNPSPRPADPVDWNDAATNVTAFRIFLHSQASDVQKLFRVFAEGCRHLLGFREVTVWTSIDKRPWELDRLNSFFPNGDDEVPPEQSVAAPSDASSGVTELSGQYRSCGMAALVEGELQERTVLVVLSDELSAKRRVAPPRLHLARELLREFTCAHSAAVRLERERYLQVARQGYATVVGDILAESSRKHVTARDALTRAAAGLRKILPYRRVFFCLVNPERTRIRGIVDNCADDSIKIDRLTDWSLEPPIRDLQPWVVNRQQWIRIKQAENEPLANQEVVKAAHIKALAIIPITVLRREHSEVIGTIHVERYDGVVPSRSEVQDLEAFGCHLGIILETISYIDQLEATLEGIPEPILVLDAKLRPRFVNSSAHHVFPSLRHGRHPGTDQLVANGMLALTEDLQAATTGVRRLAFRRTQDAGGFERLLECQALPLADSAGHVAHGAMLRCRDLSRMGRLSATLDRFNTARTQEEGFSSVVEFARALELKWGRLWVIQGIARDTLKFFDGFSSESSKAVQQPSGSLLPADTLPSRRALGTESWECIERKKPLIFHFDPSGVNGQKITLPNSLPVIIVTKPTCPPEIGKRPGEFWIDVPLFAPAMSGGKLVPVAKLTAAWDEQVSPPVFEFLGVVARLFSTLAARWPDQNIRTAALDTTVASDGVSTG